MGLSRDLKLKGNEFSNIATFLFVGLLCFEIPNGPSPLQSAIYTKPCVSPCAANPPSATLLLTAILRR